MAIFQLNRFVYVYRRDNFKYINFLIMELNIGCIVRYSTFHEWHEI